MARVTLYSICTNLRKNRLIKVDFGVDQIFWMDKSRPITATTVFTSRPISGIRTGLNSRQAGFTLRLCKECPVLASEQWAWDRSIQDTEMTWKLLVDLDIDPLVSVDWASIEGLKVKHAKILKSNLRLPPLKQLLGKELPLKGNGKITCSPFAFSENSGKKGGKRGEKGEKGEKGKKGKKGGKKRRKKGKKK